MSKIIVKFENEAIFINKQRARSTNQDSIRIKLDEFNEEQLSIKTNIIVNKKEDRFNIFYKKYIENKVLLVYAGKKFVHVAYGDPIKIYPKLIKPIVISPKSKITGSKLEVWAKGYMYNPYKIKYESSKVYICEKNSIPITLINKKEKIRKRRLLFDKSLKFEFLMSELLYPNASINCNVNIELKIDDCCLYYPITSGYIKKSNRYNYVPFSTKYINDYAVHLRKSKTGNLVFVRRLKEDIENDTGFRIKESKFISFVLYNIGKTYKKFNKQTVNLFYEKFASKAEEGAYDLFLMAKERKNSKSYFIIDKNSKDYASIKNIDGVVQKFSWRYYWLIYISSNFIATEAPIHINIVRSNNRYFRKSTFEKEFIFLQHGVTYLKCHDMNSPFVNGKEATPSYICVGSEKEKDIVSDMLEIDEENILVTGLPVFSNIKWESINQNSENIITVMLTWKPYEEFFTSFEESTYYQFTVSIFNMLKKYFEESQIIIIPHPKIAHLMEKTSFSKNVWHDEISKALSFSKLLITDYSSVCYNSFYQGGGVVFFQPDLDYYELVNGKLIPSDDEYIGYRTYSLDELEDICKKGISNKSINLSYFRNKKFVKNYLTINEFKDGKNLNRICDRLSELGIM